MKLFFNILIFIFLTNGIIAQDATEVYKKAASSTVTIETDLGFGSGFFISENILATNYHVIEGAKEVFCYTSNITTKYIIVGYLGVDKSNDLILLKVQGLNRPALKISSSSTTQGQKVFVIGSPKGLPATISDGIISGLRDFEGNKLIQITAPISPGSSGGPLLNANGELIGISVSQIKEGQNLNFAIPVSYLEILLNFKTPDPSPINTLYSFSGSLQDNRDGKRYKTIRIGRQIWMAENLKAIVYNDGVEIQFVNEETKWKNLTSPAFCYTPPTNKNNSSVIYNWYVINTGRICPIGWHVPTDREWTILTDYLGGLEVAGGKLKEIGYTHWDTPNTGATNESGFAAIPSTHRSGYTGLYDTLGGVSLWWSASENGSGGTSYRGVGNGNSGVATGDDANKTNGFSVRCIKD